MTSGFSDPIIGGGGALVYPAIESPNFLTGISGWIIRKNGTVEFNSGTFRGTVTAGQFNGTDFVINSSGAFFYSGTPAAGNLIASIAAAAGTDPYGNSYLAGVEIHGETQLLSLTTGEAGESSAGTLLAGGTGIPGSTRQLVTELFSPGLGIEQTAVLALNSQSADGTVPASAILGQPLTVDGDVSLLDYLGTGPALIGTGRVPPTGVDDTANIANALADNSYCELISGQSYKISSQIPLAAGRSLYGNLAQIVPIGAMSSMFLVNGTAAAIHQLLAYGGSGTRSANPAADVVRIAAGVQNWILEDINASFMNGWRINLPAATGAHHGTIRGGKGQHNAGGYQFQAATTTHEPVQVDIDGIDEQNTEVHSSLYLGYVTDVLIGRLNAAVLGSAGVPTVHYFGSVATCPVSILDIGVDGAPTAAIPVLLIEDDGAGNSPTDLSFGGGTVQAGGVGVKVAGTSSKIRFNGVESKNNSGDGWLLSGTQTAISLTACVGNGNGAGVGGGYDVDVTSTAHVGLFGFAYGSTGATAARNITQAVNHVTDSNPTNPGGLGNAGNAPGGW